MTPASPDPAEPPAGRPDADVLRRHRAPALWLVVVSLTGAVVAAAVDGAQAGALVLVATLAGAAVARLVLRGRRPDGVAVRDTWVDVVVLATLAVTISALMFSPGV